MNNIFSELRRTRTIRAALLIFVGWLLSPFTFWNDIFVNIPIAYFCASAVALISKKIFFPAFLVFYWLTNVLGVFMMGEGAKDLLVGEKIKRYSLTGYLTILFYTAVAGLLIYFGAIKPLDFTAIGGLFHK